MDNPNWPLRAEGLEWGLRATYYVAKGWEAQARRAETIADLLCEASEADTAADQQHLAELACLYIEASGQALLESVETINPSCAATVTAAERV